MANNFPLSIIEKNSYKAKKREEMEDDKSDDLSEPSRRVS